MKKLISLVLILCMACMLIPAMAEEDVTGEWYGSMMGMGIIFTVNADGTFSMTAGGQEMAAGSWKVEDGKLIAEADGVAETFEIKDGTLYESEMDMTMTRNPEDAPAAIEIADVKADAAAEEYYGEWVCSAVEASGMLLGAESYTAGTGEALPGLTIAADSVKFNGEDMISSIINMFTLTPVYADGAITANAVLELGEDSNMTMDVSLQMLQDGQIKATLISNDNPMILYFAPAN